MYSGNIVSRITGFTHNFFLQLRTRTEIVVVSDRGALLEARQGESGTQTVLPLPVPPSTTVFVLGYAGLLK